MADRGTREPYAASSPEMGAIVTACKRRGLLPFTNFNRVHLVPPLTTSPAEVREAIDILDLALAEAAGSL